MYKCIATYTSEFSVFPFLTQAPKGRNQRAGTKESEIYALSTPKEKTPITEEPCTRISLGSRPEGKGLRDSFLCFETGPEGPELGD